MITTESIFELLLKPQVGLNYTLKQWQEMLFVLREAKLVASLYNSAMRHNCYQAYPDFIQQHLNSACVYAQRQALQIRFEAVELCKLLEEIDVTAIFLKGAGYTLRDSINSRGRICSDLDLLVNKQDIARAEAHLKLKRWKSQHLTDYDEQYYRQWAHEIPPLIHINRSTVVDMHHNLYPPISGRAVDIACFISSREKTQSGCFVLDPASTVMHSIIHMFANEDSSSWTRDLLDITLLVDEFQDSGFWQQLIHLAKQTKFEFEFISCLHALAHYSAIEFPIEVANYMKQRNLTGSDRWLVENVIIPAIAPEHDHVVTKRIAFAKMMVYLRGHWIKMPAAILCKHFAVKTFLSLRDKLFGKHHFDPKLPKNPNW
ncbi:nucleotidyltransferase family protein [Aliiglaciecola litoralis]|uniref:Nucleotidyltransferase family protein n=1 Tax=Aliiglaciecola litoralis TaxID=582857 RepID=A0ABN1LMN9_9ALTE